MLTSYLRGGDTVDFTIHRDTRQVPIIQMQMTADDGARVIGVISLTPTEAITVAEHLNELVNSVADYCGGDSLRYTQPPQEEEPLLNLHPRAEQLLSNADLSLTTGEHIHAEKVGERTALPSTIHSPSFSGSACQSQLDSGRSDPERGERSLPTGRFEPVVDPVLQGTERGNPLAHEDRGQGGTDYQNGSQNMADGMDIGQTDAVNQVGQSELQDAALGETPETMVNVEIDDALAGHVSEIRSSESQRESADEADQWQFDLDQFVNDLRLRPSKAPNDKKNIYFEMLSPPVSDADDEIRMPFAVTAHPWIRSQAMRKLILEVFQQAFRYGASWENAR